MQERSADVIPAVDHFTLAAALIRTARRRLALFGVPPLALFQKDIELLFWLACIITTIVVVLIALLFIRLTLHVRKTGTGTSKLIEEGKTFFSERFFRGYNLGTIDIDDSKKEWEKLERDGWRGL